MSLTWIASLLPDSRPDLWDCVSDLERDMARALRFGAVGRTRRSPEGPIRVAETPEAYLMEIEVPGAQAEDLALFAEDGAVALEVMRCAPGSAVREPAITHRMAIPREVACTRIRARYEAPVLSIWLPKRDASDVRTVPVEARPRP